MEVFDAFRSALAANRAQFFREVPSGPFFGFNREGATVSQGLIDNWWRQGMAGGAKAHHDCIAASSESDFTEGMKAIKLVKHGTLKTYPGLSHGGFCPVSTDGWIKAIALPGYGY